MLTKKKTPFVYLYFLLIEEIGATKVKQAWHELQASPSLLPKPLQEYHAIITDDVSLILDAIKPLPGPFIKWVLDSLGTTGIYDLAYKYNNFQASAVCILSLFILCTGEIHHFTGTVQGKICSPIGLAGFGWDSCFQPITSQHSFAQMTIEEKNKYSHRTLACNALTLWVKANSSQLI